MDDCEESFRGGFQNRPGDSTKIVHTFGEPVEENCGVGHGRGGRGKRRHRQRRRRGREGQEVGQDAESRQSPDGDIGNFQEEWNSETIPNVDRNAESEEFWNRPQSTRSSVSDFPVEDTHERGRRRGGRGGRYRGRGGQGGRGHRGGQCAEGRRTSDGPIRNFWQKQHSESVLTVDSNTILHYLMNCHRGSCLIADFLERSGLFPQNATPNAVIQSLKQCRNIKVLINEDDLSASPVRVIMKPLRLCFRHVPPKPCARTGCQYIHLCRDFIMDCCYRKNCICSHDVDSEQNLRVMTECGAQIFNPEQKLILIKCSNMMVCGDYNSPNGCTDQRLCFQLHICSAFALNRCLIPSNDCTEGHDLRTEGNVKVLKLYNADHLQDETIFKMLLAIQKKPQKLDSNMETISTMKVAESFLAPEKTEEKGEGHSQPGVAGLNQCIVDTGPRVLEQKPVTESVKLTGCDKNIVKFTDFISSRYEPLLQYDVPKNVCEAFEKHECNSSTDCTDRHGSRTPYLWRLKMDGQWRNLEKNNSLIEKAFCDPNTDEFFDVESISYMCIQLDFERMTSNVGQIQRLTTPSYVNCRDQVDSTVWRWYWNESLTSLEKWIPFEANYEPPYQDILEQKYQRDPKLVCCFEIDRFFYELSFETMTQTNLQTQRKRKVKRRPVFETGAEWNKTRSCNMEFHCDPTKLPDDWVPMDTESKDGTELIPLHSDGDSYKDVESKFYATMNRIDHRIRRIYRLQNLELWTSYQLKKQTIDRHMGAETEVMVFHGTSEEDTTRWICGVGFDQRMHGVNGTVYGKGAYFAKTAKYSHHFTKPSPRNNHRYMFYAKITIGNVAKGDSSMKRPPAIDDNNPKKGLYDSCADDIQNPSIYVIFDNSQTYPAYLIEYKVDSDVLSRQNSASLRLASALQPVGVSVSTVGNKIVPVFGPVSSKYSPNMHLIQSSPPVIPNPTQRVNYSTPPSNPTPSAIPSTSHRHSVPTPTLSSPPPSPPSTPVSPSALSNPASTSSPASNSNASSNLSNLHPVRSFRSKQSASSNLSWSTFQPDRSHKSKQSGCAVM